MWRCPEVKRQGGGGEGQLWEKTAGGGCAVPRGKVPHGREMGWKTADQRCGVGSVQRAAVDVGTREWVQALGGVGVVRAGVPILHSLAQTPVPCGPALGGSVAVPARGLSPSTPLSNSLQQQWLNGGPRLTPGHHPAPTSSSSSPSPACR